MLRPVPFCWLLLLLLFDPPNAANGCKADRHETAHIRPQPGGLLMLTLSKEIPCAEQQLSSAQLLFPAAIVVCYGAVAAMDRHTEVVLTPRNDPRLMDNFTCGVNSSVDAERLLAEQNTIYIFETFLDKTKETDPNYKIKVFDVVTFSKNGMAENMLDNQLGKPDMEEPGLYTLFLSPPKAQCNTRTFEDAAETSGEGYFPVYVGISGNFTEMIDKFKGSSDNFKAFYNGVIPKLCGTKLKMKAETANSRKRILTKLFNFLFNEVERSLHPTHEKSCRSAHETISALTKDDLFMMGYNEIQFKGESQAVEESDGFAKVIVMRNSSLDRKILGIVQTSFPTSSDDQCEPATSDDIVNFSNVIVFDVDETETDIYITLKEDNILEEDECFFLNLVKFTEAFSNKTRVKRMAPKNKFMCLVSDDSASSDSSADLRVDVHRAVDSARRAETYAREAERSAHSAAIAARQAGTAAATDAADAATEAAKKARADAERTNAAAINAQEHFRVGDATKLTASVKNAIKNEKQAMSKATVARDAALTAQSQIPAAPPIANEFYGILEDGLYCSYPHAWSVEAPGQCVQGWNPTFYARHVNPKGFGGKTLLGKDEIIFLHRNYDPKTSRGTTSDGLNIRMGAQGDSALWITFREGWYEEL